MNLSWPCDLLWPTRYGGSDRLLVPGPTLNRLCVLLSFLLEPYNELACLKMSELRLITRQSHICECAQPRSVSCLANRSGPMMRWDDPIES